MPPEQTLMPALRTYQRKSDPPGYASKLPCHNTRRRIEVVIVVIKTGDLAARLAVCSMPSVTQVSRPALDSLTFRDLFKILLLRTRHAAPMQKRVAPLSLRLRSIDHLVERNRASRSRSHGDAPTANSSRSLPTTAVLIDSRVERCMEFASKLRDALLRAKQQIVKGSAKSASIAATLQTVRRGGGRGRGVFLSIWLLKHA